jgi:vitamin B12 transporter
VTVAEIPADGSMRNTVLKWGAQWTDFYSTDLTLTRNTIAKRDTTPNDYETRFQGAVWDHQLKTGSGTLSALLEQKDESFVAQLHDAFNPAFQGSRIQEALGVGYSVQTGPHSLQINARRDHDNIFGNSQTGALGYGYALAPSWRLSAAAGSAFKAPTLEQIYSWYGDRQLKPETNENVELVLSYGHDGNAFKAVSYRNAIRNMISSSATLATCGAGSYCYFNVGQALIRGTTLSGTVHFKGFDLRASIDMLDPRNEDTGKLLSLRASETATVGVDMAVAGWSLGAEVQHVGSRYNEAANTNLLPSYDLLNLSASRSLGRDWKLLLRVDNATDQVYVQSLGYDTSYNPTPIVTPRATYFVGLQWQPRN